MSDTTPILWWVRRDMRLADTPGLTEAAASGRPVIPVLICDAVLEQTGACPKWRYGLGVEAFAGALESIGSRLIARRGAALEVLRDLLRETGAGAVWWSRLYDPDSIARDTAVKAALKAEGIDARSFAGHLLFEPWTVETGQGGPYRVYSPFWRAVRDRAVPTPLPPVAALTPPETWPESDRIADWALGAQMRRGAGVVRPHLTIGEAAAGDRLTRFTETRIAAYAERRDVLAEEATSGLSENLTYGEMSPRTCWHAGMAAHHAGSPGAETFLKELVWREFAAHLAYHMPQITSANWRPDWDGFPWATDPAAPEVIAWQQGRTGIPVVDAAMRELYVTGRMHNRARMIVASFLTKHLTTHWKIGMDWFADCLADWDPASNAMGWQWVAGSGPDAAPYFRVFNPERQAETFDPDGAYRRRWIAEGQSHPPATALAYFDAAPRSWGLSPDAAYPKPIIGLAEGRARALAAYDAWRG